MRKHFLRTLVVMLIACLGVGVLAACGSWTKKDPPPASETIEGIWTGATFEDLVEGEGDETYDATVEVSAKLNADGSKAYAVWKVSYTIGVETETHYAAYIFAKQEDGSYQYSHGTGNEAQVLTMKLNEQNKLVVSQSFGAASATTATATTQAALSTATAVTLSGVQYEKDSSGNYTGRVYDFAQNKVTTSSGATAKDMTTVSVGAYLFVASADETFTTVIYKDGILYYAATGEEPHSLTTTAPTPFAGYTIEYYSGIDAQNMPSDNTKYGVDDEVQVPTQKPTDPQGRTFKYWIVGEDETQIQAGGTYTVNDEDEEQGTPGVITFTAVWTKMYSVMYVSLTDDGQPDEEVQCGTDTANRFEGTAFDIIAAEPTKPGYTFAGWKLYVLDTENGVLQKVSDTVYDKDDTTNNKYTPTGEEGEDGDTLYFVAQWTVNANAEFTVEFSFGTPSHAADGQTVPTVTGAKHHGDEVTFTGDPTAEAGWFFAGWYIGNKKVTSPYSVDRDDADSDSKITITARWKSAADAYSGVWTKDGVDGSVTVLIDDEDNTKGYAIVKSVEEEYEETVTSYVYYTLTKGTDGYTGSDGMEGSATFAVDNTGTQLTVTITPPYSGSAEDPVVYDEYVPLGSNISIAAGSYLADYSSAYGPTMLLTFGATCSCKVVDMEGIQTIPFEPKYIGEYIIAEFDSSGAVIIYKSGNNYYASYSSMISILTEPGSDVAADYEGLWTSGNKTITIALDEDGILRAVVYTPGSDEEDNIQPESYVYYKLTAGLDGFVYKDVSTYMSVTLSLHGTTLAVTSMGWSGDPTTTNYTSSALPENLEIEGVYSFGDGMNSAIVDFDSNTFDMGVAMGGLLPFTVGNVGGYLILTVYQEDAPVGYQETNIVVYKTGSKYYVSGVGEAPMELTLLTFTATGYTGDTPLYFYGGGLEEGEILTFRGDLQFTRTAAEGGAFAPAVADGILGYLSQGNYLDAKTTTKEYIIFRLDNYFNNTAADKGKAQPAAGEFGDGNNNQGALAELNWSLIKHTIGLTAGSNDWFAAFCAMIAQANTTFKYELEYDYSTAGVVFISYVITTPTEFTYTYGNPSAQATVPANAQFIVRYAVTPSAGGNLDDLVIAIGGEQAVLTNISISKVEAPHIHKGTDTCEICGKTLEKSQVKNLTLTDNVAGADAWAQHIEDQTTGDYTATANTELHVTGEFGTVGADYAGFAIVLMETTTKQGLFLQYSSGSCRNSNWKTWVGSPWNLEKRTANGGFANLDQIAANTKSGHKFELVLVYDGTYAKLTIITYADDNGAIADTRTVTYNITGDALAIGIGFDGDGGNTQNVKNVQYYTITATDDAE